MPYTLDFDVGVLMDVRLLEAKILRQGVTRILGHTQDPRLHDGEQLQRFKVMTLPLPAQRLCPFAATSRN